MTEKPSERPEETAEEILDRLIRASTELSPQRKKAAKYLIDHPDEIAVVPLRQLAANAGVKASTLVRVAAAIGYTSFSQLRLPFRAQLRIGEDYISERAQKLESQGRQGGKLYAGMAQAAMTNLELLFSQDLTPQLTEVARKMVAARRVVVTAVGSGYALAHQFCYVGRMALPNLSLTPQIGGLPVDDLLDVGPRDVVLLLSFQPYRRETIDAANLARERGATVVAITDSRTSPIALPADTVFVVPTDTPQFFPSMSAVLSLLETLVALIVTQGGKKAVTNINTFNQTRRDFSIWWHED
ncbi:MurR/RpiR family transcriptional regulator [Salipiger sp. P9]|uniref:MurR/RpiR family transcriptional regulator n=1 Tax=Salipiger pentaromativorans TaxID=2943193 RepID=UPI0021572F5E|nr:MurR/RpiR family transcriptional regulator [Salipiger pentaromativorans]MCR8547515.1 MurR/RpiR family transcriptional regulator [Salipiger pentaromativorans]